MGRCWCWLLGEKEHLESALQENDKGTPRADGRSSESLCLLKGTLGASFQGKGEGLGNSNRPDPEMSHHFCLHSVGWSSGSGLYS